MVSDSEFDALCEWLLANFDACVADGADRIDRDLLSCHSGHDLGLFNKPYHDLAAGLLGHPCQCYLCEPSLEKSA